MGGNDDGLPAAEIHDVLRNDRRRLVLERLEDFDSSESVRDLAEFIATVESNESPPPQNLRQSVYVSLHQTHLPKLDDLDIVSYDSDDNVVELDSRAEEVTVFLEIVPQYGLSRSECYLGLTLLGGLFVLAAAIGVPGIATVAPGTWAVLSLATVGIIASFYTYKQGDAIFHRL